MNEQYEQTAPNCLFRTYQSVTPSRFSLTTNLDRWMNGKWIIQGPYNVVAWASREDDARVIAQALSEYHVQRGSV